MVREGQRTDRVDVIAYGAVGDGPSGTDDLTAVDTAASEADSLGFVAVWHPPNTYTVSSDPTFPGDTFPVGQGASYDGSSTTIPNLVDPAQFAGTGIEGDGSGNLRLASGAAGDGLKGGSGSALAVEPADFAGQGLEDDGSDNLRLASTAAGAGLTGGSGSALAIDFGSANDWTADQTFSGKILFDDTADAANSDQAARPIIHHGTGSASTIGIDGALHTEDV